mgnify:CR=1 FL=1
MNKEKKIKLILGFGYLLIVSIFLWIFFSKFSFQDFSSYDLIKQNRDTLEELKNSNIFLSSIIFLLGTIIWVLLLGFGSPIFLVGGFIFGKWLGALLVITSCTVGATLLYILGLVFFKDFIESKLAPRLGKFKTLFNQNETLYFALYRMSGGGLPFFMQNLLPVIFSMKVKNYFYATLIGLIPAGFILAAIGAGIDKFLIKDSLDWSGLLSDPDIYLPLIGFVIILIFGIIIKKKFFK